VHPLCQDKNFKKQVRLTSNICKYLAITYVVVKGRRWVFQKMAPLSSGEIPFIMLCSSLIQDAHPILHLTLFLMLRQIIFLVLLF